MSVFYLFFYQSYVLFFEFSLTCYCKKPLVLLHVQKSKSACLEKERAAQGLRGTRAVSRACLARFAVTVSRKRCLVYAETNISQLSKPANRNIELCDVMTTFQVPFFICNSLFLPLLFTVVFKFLVCCAMGFEGENCTSKVCDGIFKPVGKEYSYLSFTCACYDDTFFRVLWYWVHVFRPLA